MKRLKYSRAVLEGQRQEARERLSEAILRIEYALKDIEENKEKVERTLDLLNRIDNDLENAE